MLVGFQSDGREQLRNLMKVSGCNHHGSNSQINMTYVINIKELNLDIVLMLTVRLDG